MADAVLSFRVHMWALRPVEFARGLLRVYAASPFEGRCSVSGRGRGRRSVLGQMNGLRSGGAMWGVLSGASLVCPFGSITSVSFWCPMQGVFRGVLPDADAIDLHEIHLARQSSLQVPVGHIAVPGDIKLCSPGTFWVANYLIINNSSCQVNFMKPNRATIRYTNS